MSDDISRFDRVMAVFSPKSTDTLKPEALKFIGAIGFFEALWIIDEGKYKGQWAMGIPKEWGSPDFIWVPECDLQIITDKEQR